jgi:hypothetical protein
MTRSASRQLRSASVASTLDPGYPPRHRPDPPPSTGNVAGRDRDRHPVAAPRPRQRALTFPRAAQSEFRNAVKFVISSCDSVMVLIIGSSVPRSAINRELFPLRSVANPIVS